MYQSGFYGGKTVALQRVYVSGSYWGRAPWRYIVTVGGGGEEQKTDGWRGLLNETGLNQYDLFYGVTIFICHMLSLIVCAKIHLRHTVPSQLLMIDWEKKNEQATVLFGVE